jgi:hypothetical protein
MNEGEKPVDLKSTQITAAIALIKKTIPDLQAVTLTGKNDGPVEIHNLTDDELDARLKALREDSETS